MTRSKSSMEAYTTFVFKDNDGYYVAKAGNGLILAENNNAPETILQTGLDRKGRLKLQGDFLCSSGLTTQGGLKFKQDTLLDVGPETYIRVPNGYAADLFVADWTYNGNHIQNIGIEGILSVDEQGGTPARNWNALGMKLKDPGSPSQSGVTFNDFGNMFVYNAKSMVNIELLHTQGWLTSCNFKNMKGWYTRRAIDFVNTVGITTVPSISSNTFEHVWFQSSGQTDYGVKDIMGKNLWFRDVMIWDLQVSTSGTGNGNCATFTPYCGNIFVEGGAMMHYNLINNAPKGKVHFVDEYTTTQSANWQYYEEPTPFQTNGSQTGSRVYTITHGLGYSPKWIDVIPISDDALISPIKWTWNSTTITITYQGVPPPPATPGNQNNVQFRWRASVK